MKSPALASKAFVSNLMVAIMEAISLVICRSGIDGEYFIYYTHLSNLLALVVSAAYCAFTVMNRKSKTIGVLRYLCASMLAVTFLTVVFVLVPMGDSLTHMLFHRHLLFQHTLVPVVSVASFVLFEEPAAGKRQIAVPVAVTIAYGAVMIAGNVIGMVTGPYKFLETRTIGAAKSAMWIAIMTVAVCLVSVSLFAAQRAIRRRFFASDPRG